MTDWRRPKGCDTNACPEFAIEPDRVRVRSTLQPERIVDFTTKEWADLVHAIRSGEL